MVLIEYKCDKCGNVFEEFRPSDGGVVACPGCGSKKTSQNFSGRCFGSIGAGSASTGCGGSCSGCSGCKK